MDRKLKLVAGLTLSVLLTGTAPAATLSLTTATPEIFVGDSIDVDLIVGDLDLAVDGPLGAFDVNVLQTPVLLGLDAWTVGTALGDPLLLEALDTSLGDLGGGLVNVSEVSFLGDPELVALQSPSFLLATVHLTALATPGVTTLSVAGALLSDSLGLFPIDVTGTTDLRVTVRERQVGASEPPVLGLLLIGAMLVLAARSHRRGLSV